MYLFNSLFTDSVKQNRLDGDPRPALFFNIYFIAFVLFYFIAFFVLFYCVFLLYFISFLFLYLIMNIPSVSSLTTVPFASFLFLSKKKKTFDR